MKLKEIKKGDSVYTTTYVMCCGKKIASYSWKSRGVGNGSYYVINISLPTMNNRFEVEREEDVLPKIKEVFEDLAKKIYEQHER